MSDIRPPRTEAEYEAALAEIERLMAGDPAIGSASADRLEVLAILVEDYEERRYPIPDPDDPVEVILFYLDKKGLTRKDLEAFIGNRARVSDVLNRKRSLSMAMVRRLSAGLGIPADFLIVPTRTVEERGGAQVFAS